MKLINFRIKNYKSIIDTKEASVSDDIFIIAGQNEAGKSSALEALDAYENENFDSDTIPFVNETKNRVQTVECTYKITDIDAFYEKFNEKVIEEYELSLEDEDNIFKLEILKEKLDLYTIIKSYDHDKGDDKKLTIEISKTLLNIIKSAIKIQVSEDDEGLKKEAPYLDIDDNDNEKIANILFSISPEIILFNDFRDLLPDQILISDLKTKNKEAKGYSAVRNFEKLVDIDLVKMDNLTDAQRNSLSEKKNNIISATFQKDWSQRIYGNNEVNIKADFQKRDEGKSYVNFTIETKKNEFLPLRKRSKGVIWFLSVWLELKSKSEGRQLIILLDEPGLYLHIKAQKNILDLFEYLVSKNHQIIFSTHSPTLINTNNLNSISLVLNNEKSGTIIEKLTTTKLNTKNKKDALQPISEAMGLEPLKEFGILKQKNVIVEGLSDFWYFKGMKHLLEDKNNYEFVPGIGIKDGKINHLISFCIGYGLSWLLVMDAGRNSTETYNNLKKELFDDNEEEASKKIKIINGVNGIENIFSCEDLKLINDTIANCTEAKNKVDVVGKKNKILFSKIFFEKVKKEEIQIEQISKKTKDAFKEIFDHISKNLK
ncbi:AAA family ATPase [Candidatus Parcubacteria bacterium]|nr:AAA family ATPase [Candidatus Parcubacteria bacterium]